MNLLIKLNYLKMRHDNSSRVDESKENMKEEQNDKFEKIENLIFNILFGIMICLTVVGTIYLCLMLSDYLTEFESIKPDYKIPKFQDFSLTLIAMPFMIVIKFLILDS